MSNDGATLVGDSLLSFGDGIDQPLREDILDCLMYAQLSADKKYLKRTAWKPWIEQYQRVIHQNGGSLNGAIDPMNLKIKRLRDLRNLPLASRGTATSPQLRALMNASLETLLDSPHAKTFFNSWFSSGRSESFEVVPCQIDDEGGVTILVCGLQMTTTAVSNAAFFWQALSGEMTVRSNGASFRFSAQGYAPYRDKIRNYLTATALKKIEVLTL